MKKEIIKDKKSITILGAGVAGLSVGYYSKKHSIPFKIFESSNNVGGNSQTINAGNGFYFDSGAHRFHDKDEDATGLIQKIIGKNLLIVNKPTQIFYKGKFVDFPLSPFNLLKTLGILDFSKALFEIVIQKMRNNNGLNFEDSMIGKYGKLIASKFLLNYSKKLWGINCSKLSPSVAGKRLAGLDFKTLLLEVLFGEGKKTKHLDGTFYYPKYGIGMISDKLSEICGKENVYTSSEITKIVNKNNKITKIQINNDKIIDVELLVNTLPITSFLRMMDPLPPKKILDIAKSLRFRNVKLVVLFLNKPCITKSATIHFPDLDIPFTRVYEPRNRSKYMSPKGKTSLVIEFPYGKNEKVSDNDALAIVKQKLTKVGLFKEEDIIEKHFYDIENAYPVLEVSFEKKLNKIFDYLKSFDNLHLSGRSGLFRYSWIHNQIKSGKDIVEKYLNTKIHSD